MVDFSLNSDSTSWILRCSSAVVSSQAIDDTGAGPQSGRLAIA